MRTEYSFLRPQKAEALKYRYSTFGKKESLTYQSFSNATILPLHKEIDDGLLFGLGGVIADGNFIKESGIEGRVGGYYPYNDCLSRNEKVVYCGAYIRHWGHFLIESVARLWYFLENDPSIDKYVFITKENHGEVPTGNYREFLELLGIIDKIEVISSPTAYREVIVPELGYSRTHYYTDQFKAVFDRVVANGLKKYEHEKEIGPDLVFLSRSCFETAIKTECGLDMLDNYFSRNGYTILSPEKLRLCDQIWYLNNAEICAAESGTLPHNFLFCQDGKKVIVIERQTTVNETQTDIDQIKELNVTYIDGHFTIYPTKAGYGPYYLAYNDCFSAFTDKYHYIEPDNRYLKDAYHRKCLRKFFSYYKNQFGYQWGFEKWQLKYDYAYFEAYEDTLKTLGKWLSCGEPLYFVDCLKPHFLKIRIKKYLLFIFRK